MEIIAVPRRVEAGVHAGLPHGRLGERRVCGERRGRSRPGDPEHRSPAVAFLRRGRRNGLRGHRLGLRRQIEVFVEPLSLTLFAFWERALARQTPAAAATIIDGPPTLLGGRLLLDADGEASSLSDAHLRQQLSTAAQDAIRAGISRQVTLTSSDGEALRAFIEVIARRPR
jgi:hypothetical protein